MNQVDRLGRKSSYHHITGGEEKEAIQEEGVT